jgi:Ca2+:H+ antiporter
MCIDWLEGVLLMASYVIIALAAWFYPNIEENQC